MFVHLFAVNVQNWLGSPLISHTLVWLPYQSKYMVTIKKIVLHLVDICSLVQNIESRFVAGRSRYVAWRSRFAAGRFCVYNIKCTGMKKYSELNCTKVVPDTWSRKKAQT